MAIRLSASGAGKLTSGSLTLLALSDCAHIFRATAEANPSRPLGWTWSYAKKTSNNNLRVHLRSQHPKEYIDACKANGWSIAIKELRPKDAKVAVQKTLDLHLTPRAEAFSKHTFNAHLLNFIVADDQVSGPSIIMHLTAV